MAVSVGVYSLVQVRSGRWAHMDASIPQERRQLNLFLVFLLFGCAALLWWSGQPRPAFMGLAVGVSWSRLVSQRHTPQEVVAGLLAGGVAGLVFHLVVG